MTPIDLTWRTAMDRVVSEFEKLNAEVTALRAIAAPVPDWDEELSFPEPIRGPSVPVVIGKTTVRPVYPIESDDPQPLPATSESQWPRDRDWILAMADALGLDSGYELPIVPEVEPFRRLFAALLKRAPQPVPMVLSPPTESELAAIREALATAPPGSVVMLPNQPVPSDKAAAAMERDLGMVIKGLATDTENHRIELAASQAELARLAVRVADDEEEVGSDWLLSVGFTGGNDEPDVDVYDRSVSNTGLFVRVIIRYRRQEMVSSCLILGWVYRFGSGPGRTTLSHEITDYPTRGDVRRLCESLGIRATPKEADHAE